MCHFINKHSITYMNPLYESNGLGSWTPEWSKLYCQVILLWLGPHCNRTWSSWSPTNIELEINKTGAFNRFFAIFVEILIKFGHLSAWSTGNFLIIKTIGKISYMILFHRHRKDTFHATIFWQLLRRRIILHDVPESHHPGYIEVSHSLHLQFYNCSKLQISS